MSPLILRILKTYTHAVPGFPFKAGQPMRTIRSVQKTGSRPVAFTELEYFNGARR